MKRRYAFVLFVIFLPVFLFADFSYQFDLVSLNPLHKEYIADRDRASLDIQYLLLDKFPEGVYQNGTYYEFGVGEYNAQQPTNHDGNVHDTFEYAPAMGLLHLGETLSLCRSTFNFDSFISPIAIDFSFQGSLIVGMEGGFADMIGYDGVFFYGGSARFADMVSMRFGIHHYCTHYGDGTLKALGLDYGRYADSNDDPWKFQMNHKYIRMDDLCFGLSVEPIYGVRVYAEYLYSPKFLHMYLAPTMYAPNIYGGGDNVDNKPDSYKGQIVQFGIELSYPIFPKLGNTTLAYDCNAYEEGRIRLYKEGNDAAPGKVDPESKYAYYDGSLSWEFEHELSLIQELNDYISIEIGYHNGRFPLNSFYNQTCNYGYAGIRYNPDATVRLVDKAKK